MTKPFLSADWNKLVFANYVVDPEVLKPHLPAGTELDFYHGRCYVSLVGFLFLHTRVRGMRIPGHTDFEEFNLRFYVRYKEAGEWKRGVVFVKEIVPRRMISYIANLLYGEHYYYMKMRHAIEETTDTLHVRYEFLYKQDWNRLEVWADKHPQPLIPESEAAFITEHYWGYTRLSSNSTSEYQVEHPSWNIHEVSRYNVHCNTLSLYGPAIHEYLNTAPSSVFMADGSAVRVLGRKVYNYQP